METSLPCSSASSCRVTSATVMDQSAELEEVQMLPIALQTVVDWLIRCRAARARQALGIADHIKVNLLRGALEAHLIDPPRRRQAERLGERFGHRIAHHTLAPRIRDCHQSPTARRPSSRRLHTKRDSPPAMSCTNSVRWPLASMLATRQAGGSTRNATVPKKGLETIQALVIGGGTRNRTRVRNPSQIVTPRP